MDPFCPADLCPTPLSCDWFMSNAYQATRSAPAPSAPCCQPLSHPAPSWLGTTSGPRKSGGAGKHSRMLSVSLESCPERQRPGTTNGPRKNGGSGKQCRKLSLSLESRPTRQPLRHRPLCSTTSQALPRLQVRAPSHHLGRLSRRPRKLHPRCLPATCCCAALLEGGTAHMLLWQKIGRMSVPACSSMESICTRRPLHGVSARHGTTRPSGNRNAGGAAKKRTQSTTRWNVKISSMPSAEQCSGCSTGLCTPPSA